MYEENVLNLIDLDNADMNEFRIGESAACAARRLMNILKSIELANPAKWMP